MPLPQGFREWLAKESQLWHEQGILQPGQRDQILARYPEEEAGTGRMAFVLRAFGVLLFGAAVMLVVGHNWSELARGERRPWQQPPYPRRRYMLKGRPETG